MNLNLPNPALPSDINAAIMQLLSGAAFPAPGLTVTPAPTTGATTLKYQVVLKSNGAVVPSAVVTIANGPATLGTGVVNLAWNVALQGLPNLTWDVYRTYGGATQGRIAVGLPGTTQSLQDNGLVADGTTAPTYNNTAVTPGAQGPAQVAAGTTDAITIPCGKVFITTGQADALTLPLPVAGAPSAGGMDGYELLIYAISGYAHTVTTPTSPNKGFNNANSVCTFTAAAKNLIRLNAYNGSWWVSENVNGTLSA
jgi:hypothetical protein